MYRQNLRFIREFTTYRIEIQLTFSSWGISTLTPKEFSDIVIKALQAEFNTKTDTVSGYRIVGVEVDFDEHPKERVCMFKGCCIDTLKDSNYCDEHALWRQEAQCKQ